MTAKVSIGGENYYKVVDQPLPAGDKSITLNNKVSNGSIFYKLGDDSGNTNFKVLNQLDLDISKINSNGTLSVKNLSKIPNSNEDVGSRGDLTLQARNDNEDPSSCNLRFHYDANSPQMNVNASIISRAIQSSVTGNNIIYTPSSIKNGYIQRDPQGVKRTDAFPAAVNLIAQIKDAKIGDNIDLMIENIGTMINDYASTQPYIELTTPSDVWNCNVGQNIVSPGETKVLKIVITAITPSPTYSVYTVGSSNSSINNFMTLTHNAESGSYNIDIDETYTNVVQLLEVGGEGINVLPLVGNSNMFLYNSYGVKNRGPRCNVKVIVKLFVGKDAPNNIITMKLNIFKNGVVINNGGDIEAEVMKRDYSSPMLTNTAFTSFDSDDIITASIAKGSGTSVIRIYGLQILVLQI